MTTDTSQSIRPTKKQRELLSYIEQFITEHGYSPSYREIMNGLNYTSVATVSLHVTSLIRRGHLRKRDRSARSLEVVDPSAVVPPATPETSVPDGNWLVNAVELRLTQAEASEEENAPDTFKELGILIEAVCILGMEAAARSFSERLEKLAENPGGEA